MEDETKRGLLRRCMRYIGGVELRCLSRREGTSSDLAEGFIPSEKIERDCPDRLAVTLYMSRLSLDGLIFRHIFHAPPSVFASATFARTEDSCSVRSVVFGLMYVWSRQDITVGICQAPKACVSNKPQVKLDIVGHQPCVLAQ